MSFGKLVDPEDIGKWSMSICNCLLSRCSFQWFLGRIGWCEVVQGSSSGLRKKVDLLGRKGDQ